MLSFIGFKPLVANLYPILGYLGLFVIAVLVYQYFRYRDRLDREGELRTAAVDLVTDEENLDPDSEFADMSLDELAEESMLDDEEFQKALESEVEDENDEDTKDADSADGTDSEGSDAAADSSTGSGSTKI